MARVSATASDFVEDARDPHLELQNALARLGATHLQESAIVASAVLEEVHARLVERFRSAADDWAGGAPADRLPQ